MERKVTLKFHGYLKKLCGAEATLYVRSALEAVEAFNAQTKVFSPRVGSDKLHMFRLVGYDTEKSLNEDLKEDVINVVPDFCGNKGTLGKILTAVAIIAVVWWNPGGWFYAAGSVTAGAGATAATVTTFSLTTAGTMALGMAASMAIGGISQLITPTPELDGPNSPEEQSKILSNNKNTVKSGTRIPIGFGRAPLGGHILSFNVDSTDMMWGVFPPLP